MKKNTKQVIFETKQLDDSWAYITLREAKELVDSYIEKFGKDAQLSMSGNYYDDYGDVDTDDISVYIKHSRLETDAEYTARLAREEKARQATLKRKQTKAEKDAKKKATEEEKERALLEKLKKKYEDVSPDESK